MKTPKRPRDPAQLAKMIVDIATGEVDDGAQSASPVSANAKGAAARSAALSPERRKEIAAGAAAARWKGKKPS